MWRVYCERDVLESFKNAIKAQSVILADTADRGKNFYIPNDAYVTSVKTKTDIVQFPNGLLENGQYILITAGGVVSL